MKNGKMKFNYIGDFSEGLAMVEMGGKWGFINEQEELVIPCGYHEVGDFFEGFAKVKVNVRNKADDFFGEYDFWWFIDKSGNQISSLYQEVESFSEGFAAVCRDGMWGFINEKDEPVIPFEYDKADFFFEGLAAVQKHGKWGFIDKSNTLIIPYEKQFIRSGFPIFFCISTQSREIGRASCRERV